MCVERTISGIRFIKDGLGQVWRHNDHPTEEIPERWLLTDFESFEHAENLLEDIDPMFLEVVRRHLTN